MKVQAPLTPGFKPPSGCALGYGQAVRCSLNGQAMLAYEPDLRFLCRNRTSSARRAGWFKGEYVRLSRLTCPVGSSARNALAHPCLRGGWRAQRAGRGQPQSGLYNSLPGRAIHNPQRPKDAVKPKNLRPQSGRQTLELFPQPFSTTLLHNPPPTGGHNPRGEAPSTLTPKACPKTLFERKRLYAI